MSTDDDAAAGLAADLRAAGFHAPALREAWGPAADDALGRGHRIPAQRALAGRKDALAVLARLLVLGLPQPVEQVAAALPRTGPAVLERLGLAARGDGSVTPQATIRPQDFGAAQDFGASSGEGGSGAGVEEGEWWIASDLDEAALGGRPLPEEHVLGAGGASLALAGLQLPTPARRVLDLGTGCGIQALRARRYAEEVVATDVSARALRYTALNAALNATGGITPRAGSLYDPVAGERFDRIVSNPPFVITPRAADVPAYDYRDGGLVGDALVEAVVTGAGRHLEPGGVAQLLGNWETRRGMDGLDRIRSWVEASPVPLDAWVVERERLSPVEYAELWIRDGGTLPGTAAHAALLDAWLADFEARDVTEVGLGFVLLRRAEGVPALARYERLGQRLPHEGGLGAHLARALAVHDRLQAMDDDTLAAARLRVAPDVTEARHHRPGAADPSVIELRQGGGFGRTVTVDTAVAAVVGACDGELAAGPLIAAVAGLLDLGPGDLRTAVLPELRALLIDGFLDLA